MHTILQWVRQHITNTERILTKRSALGFSGFLRSRSRNHIVRQAYWHWADTRHGQRVLPNGVTNRQRNGVFSSTKMDKEISPQQRLTVLSFQNDTVAKTHAVVT